MAGKPFKVGRFAHTLRVRLMREHIGVDVDAMYEEDLMAAGPVQSDDDKNKWDPDHEEHRGAEEGITHVGRQKERSAKVEAFHEFKDGAMQGSLCLSIVTRMLD